MRLHKDNESKGREDGVGQGSSVSPFFWSL